MSDDQHTSPALDEIREAASVLISKGVVSFTAEYVDHVGAVAKRKMGRPRKHPAPDPNAPKRPRGRPRKEPGAPSVPASEAVKSAAVKGRIARWGGLHRERCKQIGVDPDAAAELATVPERDRRRLASDAIRAAVAAYKYAHIPRD